MTRFQQAVRPRTTYKLIIAILPAISAVKESAVEYTLLKIFCSLAFGVKYRVAYKLELHPVLGGSPHTAPRTLDSRLKLVLMKEINYTTSGYK